MNILMENLLLSNFINAALLKGYSVKLAGREYLAQMEDSKVSLVFDPDSYLISIRYERLPLLSKDYYLFDWLKFKTVRGIPHYNNQPLTAWSTKRFL